MKTGKKTNYSDFLAVAILAIIGFVAYSNTFRGPFNLDDIDSIVSNPAIKNILDLRGIWDFWPTRFITYLSIAINYKLDALRVFGYHVFNFLIHLGSTILVWLLAIATLNTPSIKKEAMSINVKLAAFFTGAIFLLHPIQTQPVNYITQRATLLAAFFYIASLYLYAKARLSKESAPGSSTWKAYYGISLLAAVMSMFSKEIVVSLPFVICLYEFFFLTDKKRFEWKYVVPFMVTALIIPITMLTTRSIDFIEMKRVSEYSPGICAWNYFLTQLKVMVTYVRLLFIPVNQNLDYDYKVARSIFEIPVISSLLALTLILSAGIRLFRKYKLISFGIFFFFIVLLPESSIIPIKDVIFEHRLYLPMVGFAIIVVSGLCYLLKEKKSKLIVIGLILITFCYSVMTYQRNKVWENPITLWSDAARKSPLKARPYNNLGYYVYLVKGDLDRAISNFNKAIEINPGYPDAYNNRGCIYQNKGDLVQAIYDFSKAIEINPRYASAYGNRGLAYANKGNLEQAISDCNKAIEIKPGCVEAYFTLGLIYLSKGNFDQALFCYDKAIEVNPDYADAYNNRAVVYFKKQEYFRSWEDVHRAQALGCEVEPQLIKVLKKASGREK